MSETLTQFQRECYLVAKTAYYVVIKRIDPDVFASYFLKTVMFKLLEKQPCSFWENSLPTEVVQTLFNDLSCCFKEKVLKSFFVEDLNLLEGIENDKLRFASIESAAVAKCPLAFLPENFDQKFQLFKKEVYLMKEFAYGMKKFDGIIPFIHFSSNVNQTYKLFQ